MKTHSDNKSFIEALKNSIVTLKEMDYANSVIILINPNDLLEFDMKDFSSDAYFVGKIEIETGTAYALKEDSELKRWMYDFAHEHPDRVLRGEKTILAELGGKA
jgi:hypothetical protein